ncbi:MAG: hypothetical protein ACUVRA_01575 [Candidatus Bathyarchaeaceae archaeon]
MPRRPLGLLSLGVLAVIVAVCLLVKWPKWDEIFFLVIAFSGVWIVVVAGIRAVSPEKYERGAFSTFGWGTMLIAIGGAWFLARINLLYSVALLLIVIGVLAAAAALRLWR